MSQTTPGGTTEDVTFDSDEYTLSGVLHLPEAPRPPCVVGCHGLFADKQSPKQIALAEACAARGIAWLRFDHRGCGDSAGDFKQATTLAGRCQDLISALEFLDTRDDLGPVRGLFGSSMGGAVCLNVASRRPVAALVVNAAPAFRAPLVEVLKQSGDDVRLGPAFFDETFGLDLCHATLDVANILVFHGTADNVVPASHGELIYEKAREQKKLIMFDNGDHAMSDAGHQKVFVMKSVQWFVDYLAG